MALSTGNIHQYLAGAQGALPVDAHGGPWTGKYVYDSGNLATAEMEMEMAETAVPLWGPTGS